MPDDDLESAIRQDVQISQIICVALCLGPIVLAVVATLVLAEGEAKGFDTMALVALANGLAALALQSVVSGVVASQGVQQWRQSGQELPQLAKAHQVKTIIALAICEGAAFLCLIVYGVFNPTPWLLAMAALMIAVNASRFPTVTGVADWCRNAAASR
ncbi:MAG: hypothetical protein AAGJ46_05925 [Planctomycetota bacterium]